MTGLDTTSIMIPLKSARKELVTLNRTVKHTLCLANERSLISPPSHSQHVRRPPSTWGARCDAFFWDAWDRSIRGENDMHRFFEIAERIGGLLYGLEESDAAHLLPGTMLENIGSCSDLFLPDYWLFVVHHLGRTGQLPYECHLTWSHGTDFNDEPFAVVSRLPVNIVQASIDALTVLIDAMSLVPRNREPEEDGSLEFDAGVPESAGGTIRLDHAHALTPLDTHGCKRPPRKRAERATNIEMLNKELKRHIRAARDHAQAAIDHGRIPELLPRPSQKDLADRIGITDSAASRCFNDAAAVELRLLWQIADDLDAVMKHVRN